MHKLSVQCLSALSTRLREAGVVVCPSVCCPWCASTPRQPALSRPESTKSLTSRTPVRNLLEHVPQQKERRKVCLCKADVTCVLFGLMYLTNCTRPGLPCEIKVFDAAWTSGRRQG